MLLPTGPMCRFDVCCFIITYVLCTLLILAAVCGNVRFYEIRDQYELFRLLNET